MQPPEHLAYTPDQRTLRAELRSYFAALVTEEVRRDLRLADTATPTARTLHLKLGADGWLGVGWPKEYGGRGRPRWSSSSSSTRRRAPAVRFRWWR